MYLTKRPEKNDTISKRMNKIIKIILIVNNLRSILMLENFP